MTADFFGNGAPLGLCGPGRGRGPSHGGTSCATVEPGRAETSEASRASAGDQGEEGLLEAERASALRVALDLANSIRAELAPNEAHLDEVCLFDTGPVCLPGALSGAGQGDGKTPTDYRSSSSLAAAAPPSATGAQAAAADAKCREGHSTCDRGDGGSVGGSGGCLKQGDIEAAAAAGYCSWCCGAFPRLSFPQVSQSTIRRLFLLQRHNFELAGVRWLCAVLQPSGPRDSVGAAVLADDAGMGRTCQVLMLLSLGYQLGAFTDPTLVVVSGGPCNERCNSSSNSNNSSSSSSGVADLLQMRRWVHLAKEWAPSLTLRPLLCPEDVHGSLYLPHVEGGATPGAATAAAAAGAPSLCGVHASAASEDQASSRKADDVEVAPTGGPYGPLYLTTFAAVAGGPQSRILQELRKQHDSLALFVVDARCRRQCDRQQKQQQQQPQQGGEGGPLPLPSRCCSALASERSLSCDAMAAADACWGTPEGELKCSFSKAKADGGSHSSAGRRVKKLIIPDKHSTIDSYAALRLLLPQLLPNVFSGPKAVDRLAFWAAGSGTKAAAEAASQGPAPAEAAAAREALVFARRCAFPLVLRRSRASVLIRELPPPNRKLHRLALTPTQTSEYTAIEAACSQGLLAAAGVASPTAAHESINSPGGLQEDVKTITARAVAAMRLTCVHPALIARCSSSSISSRTTEDGVEAGDEEPSLVSPQLLERVVQSLAVAAPPPKSLCLKDGEDIGTRRREALRRRVQKWRQWELLHVALQLGLLQHSVVQRQLLNTSSKLAWLADFLQKLRADAQDPTVEAKAAEFSGREAAMRPKVLLLNPLPLTCGDQGSVGLFLRDVLRPRPLWIDSKDTPLSATQKIRDFKKAEFAQLQVLLIEDMELLLELPPHLFSGIQQVVWLASALTNGEKHRQGIVSEKEAPISPTSDGCAALTQAVEQRLMSVASDTPITVHYLVCPRTYEECYLRPEIHDGPPFA